jgi:hypothetical protein
MLRKIVIPVAMACMCFGNAYAYAGDMYYYKGVCPGGKVIKKCEDKNHDGKSDFPCDYWSDPLESFVDVWGFAQCNCTSYVANMLRDPFNVVGAGYDSTYGVNFKNSYLGQHWGDGGKWGEAAKKANIAVDMIPLPGDAVYFDGSDYGHIARVEWVQYDDNMNWERFKLSEYNIKKEAYGERIITREMAENKNSSWINKPKGFIHILATKNPEFYFNFYDLGYDFAGQTKEEWEYIYALVLKKYYDGNNDMYELSFQNVWNGIGGELPVGFGGIGGSYISSSANYTLTPENGYGNTPQNESYLDPNHKHAISMDDTEISIRGQESYDRKITFTQYDIPTVDLRVKMKEKLGIEWNHNQLFIQWWLSPNDTFTTYDVLLGTDSPSSNLDPHEKHRERITGIAGLQSLAPGKYWIYPRFIFPADNQGNVQYNMASNQDRGEYIELTILPKYDFETTWFSSDKYVAQTGEQLSLWVNATSYGGMFPYDVRVGLYVSGEGYDNKLFSAKVFHPNGDLGTAFEVKTIAPALPGNYTLKLIIDDEGQHPEWNESNNQLEFPLTVTARGPDADIGEGFQVQSTETYDGWQEEVIYASPSEALEVKANIINNGDEDIIYSEMSFKVSMDLDFNQEEDWHFAWSNSNEVIEPGGTITQTATLVAPYNPGTYYLYGYIPVITGESDNPEQNWWNNKSRNDTILEYVKIIVE